MRRARKMLLGCAGVVVALLLGGCVSHRVYHCPSQAGSTNAPNHSFACIELDELGELWRPDQITEATSKIRQQSGKAKPVLLVIFVHGWKHNASTNDANYQSFVKFTEKLAEKPGEPGIFNPVAQNFHLMGVYIGWRGSVTSVPFVEHLTFWSRRNAAVRAAGTSATESIFTLIAAAREHPNSKVVLIGHSMGALLVEKAVTQAMVGSMIMQGTLENEATSRPPADLTLLVNSAAESTQAKQFIQMLKRRGRPPGTGPEQPLIISVTSVGDNATRVAFPWSMTLGSLTRQFRDYDSYTNTCPCPDAFPGSQRYYYVRTAGHNSRLWSHQVKEVGAIREAHENRTIRPEQTDLWENLGRQGRWQFRVGSKIYEILPVENSPNDTPYWVMQVPKGILKDHGGIFKNSFWGFAGALFRLTDTQRPESQGRGYLQKL